MSDVGIGAALRESREEQGRELADAAAATSMRVTQLEAIEADRWEIFGGDVYAKGFLRSYAVWLGVDPELAPPQQEAPVNRSSQQPAELDPALHDRLRDYFRDSDLALIETLDRSLPWRTPDE